MQQSTLIQHLKSQNPFGHDQSWTFKETQLSYVFLTKKKAYKIKKALQVGALDLADLETRRALCEKETVCNGGLSPDLYLGVVPLYQNVDGTPTLEEHGLPVEYAVAMNRFAEDNVFLNMLESNSLEEAHLTQLTDLIVRQHDQAPFAPGIKLFDALREDVHTTLESLGKEAETIDVSLLAGLYTMFEESFKINRALIQKRQSTHVKHLHGDLGLKSICLHKGQPTVFDSAKGTAPTQGVDTIADLAFLLVDLFFWGRRDLAILVLNRYLKRTDDFEGLKLVRLYGAQQAIRRGLIYSRAAQRESSQARRVRHGQNSQTYAEIALYFLSQTFGKRVVVIGGVSGAGKTTLGRALAQRIGAVHIRADAVRKHLWGVPVYEKAPLEAYNETHSEKTYQGLQERASQVLNSGLSVVVDGVFAHEKIRDNFTAFAITTNAAFTAVWCTVPAAVAQKRIQQRLDADGKEADNEGYLHEKQMLFNPGRVSWHRLDMLYGVEQLVPRMVDLLKLSRIAQ